MKKSFKNIQNFTKINKKIEKIKENYNNYKLVSELTNKWKEIMAQTNTYNQEFLTFTLSHIQVTSCGFSCRIYAPYGLTYNELENIKPIIEDNLSCIFIYVKKRMSQFVMAKIVNKEFCDDNVKYTPPCITPYELYLGKSIEGNDVVICSKEVSHFLLSGSNGSGKSRLLDCIITTLIYNCTPSELELYLVQISKNDLVIYEDSLCCRAFCETLDQTEVMLNHIIKKLKQRDRLIKPMRKDFKGSDISDYNKLHCNKKLSVCWIIIDEVASLMNKTGNNNKIKKQKDRIIAMIEEIARVGRALGIFLGCCLQRPKADSLSPDVKAQANLRISFSQNNTKSSEVAMDDGSIAVGLDTRIAVYSCRANGYDFIKTPYINDSIIAKYIKPKCQRGHRTLFDDLKKLEKNNININKKIIEDSNNKNNSKNAIVSDGTITLPDNCNIKPIEKDIKKDNKDIIQNLFDKVDPIQSNKLQNEIFNNIKNIPNFVPYNPNKNSNVIDETNLLNIPTQKPIKKGDS